MLYFTLYHYVADTDEAAKTADLTVTPGTLLAHNFRFHYKLKFQQENIASSKLTVH